MNDLFTEMSKPIKTIEMRKKHLAHLLRLTFNSKNTLTANPEFVAKVFDEIFTEFGLPVSCVGLEHNFIFSDGISVYNVVYEEDSWKGTDLCEQEQVIQDLVRLGYPVF